MKPKTKKPRTETFGQFFKDRRISLGLTLRKFCIANNYDPGNISKLERDLMPPPESEDKLLGYADALSINYNSKEWKEMISLARGRSEIWWTIEGRYGFLSTFRQLRKEAIEDAMDRYSLKFIYEKWPQTKKRLGLMAVKVKVTECK